MIPTHDTCPIRQLIEASIALILQQQKLHIKSAQNPLISPPWLQYNPLKKPQNKHWQIEDTYVPVKSRPSPTTSPARVIGIHYNIQLFHTYPPRPNCAINFCNLHHDALQQYIVSVLQKYHNKITTSFCQNQSHVENKYKSLAGIFNAVSKLQKPGWNLPFSAWIPTHHHLLSITCT